MAGVYWVVSRQLAKAGTSIAANMEEAQGAQSRADFNAKLYISLKESWETLYWLRLLNESELIPSEQIAELTEESDQLLRILTAITRKPRKPKKPRKSIDKQT